MLKKIAVSQLRVGMYVQELCSSWIDTPFWQKSFKLASQEEVNKIVASKIKEAWIDTSKGLDVAEARQPTVVPETVAEIPEVPATPAPTRELGPVSMDEEIGRASRIVNRSRDAVFSMFSEARMGKAIDVDSAQTLVEEISDSVMRNPGALIGLARLKTKDDYTYMHSVAVCALMVALARQLGLNDSQTRAAGLAGLLHDIGKMAIDSDILNKPGRLTDEEFVAVKRHPTAGFNMLRESGNVGNIALDVCLHHHEKIDGTGYPKGLKGDQISLYARMGAICDVYDAITSNRPYKQGWCPAESLRKMAEWAKSHFDEKIFQAFVKSIGIYPVGTLVRMDSGRLGVVVEQQPQKSLLAPKIRVFFSIKSMTYIVPELLDLARPGVLDKIAGREDAAKWGLKDINRYWLEPAVTS